MRRILGYGLKIGIVCSILWGTASAGAQEKTEGFRSQGFSIGYSLDSSAGDFGIGLRLGSPYFFERICNIRLSGDIAWAAGVPKGGTDQTWTPYGLFKIGYYAARFLPDLPVRIYGGGGFVLLTHSSALASAATAPGGYGAVGVELFPDKDQSSCLFLELGGMGTGARADQMVSSPFYANGFTAAWGYEFYL